MSSNLAYAQPLRSPRRDEKRETPQRRIEIVSTRTQRRARPRPIYAIVAVSGVFALFLAQLLLSIVVSDGAYQISSLQAKEADLSRSSQSLNEQVDLLSSTQNLASKAEALGMVLSATTPAFLNLADGTVVGKSTSTDAESNGVLGAVGNLVPNSLLDTTAMDEAATTDAATVDGTAAAGMATPSDVVASETGTDAVVSNGSTAVDTAVDTPATGAPASDAAGTSVTSESGLPTPITR
jgi:cell division protein FtsB